MNPSASPH